FLLPLHPFIVPFVAANTQNASVQFKQAVNQQGSPVSSTSYTNTVEPSLVSMLSAKMLGTDFFQSDTPRTTRFAEWTMQVLTPPEVRFKLAANSYSQGYPSADLIPRKSMAGGGDSSTQSSVLTGVLAQGFRDTNPALAARLMGAWTQMGKPHGD